jgi:hypothetical protein
MSLSRLIKQTMLQLFTIIIVVSSSSLTDEGVILCQFFSCKIRPKNPLSPSIGLSENCFDDFSLEKFHKKSTEKSFPMKILRSRAEAREK